MSVNSSYELSFSFVSTVSRVKSSPVPLPLYFICRYLPIVFIYSGHLCFVKFLSVCNQDAHQVATLPVDAEPVPHSILSAHSIVELSIISPSSMISFVIVVPDPIVPVVLTPLYILLLVARPFARIAEYLYQAISQPSSSLPVSSS